MDQVYTLDKVVELAEGDKEFINELVSAFLEEIPKDLRYLEGSVRAGKAKVAYQYAHKMKPSFQMFSIDVLNEIKLLESWSEDELDQEQAMKALSVILEKSSLALNLIKKDFKK